MDLLLVIITCVSVAVSWIALIQKHQSDHAYMQASTKLKETEALYFFTRWMQERDKNEPKDENISGLRITENGIEFE